MTIKKVDKNNFKRYGFLADGYDFAELLKTLAETTPCPKDGVTYVPENSAFHELPVYKQLKSNLFGGMPLQLGYCNGHNLTLNCLEYHRGSELIVPADPVVLLLASVTDIEDNKIDTSAVEAFLVPASQAVVLYETTLHYAPCSSKDGDGFRVIIGLPQGTNTEKPEIKSVSNEDKKLWAANKWLLAHPESPEATNGAYIGITGDNIKL